MSAYIALSGGIVDLFDADTGSGGFNHATVPVVTAYANFYVPNESTFPFLVFLPISIVDESGFDNDIQTVRVQFSIFVERRSGLTVSKAIGDRLRTVIRRVDPTVTGWTVSAGEFTEVTEFIEGETIHSIYESEYVMTKD